MMGLFKKVGESLGHVDKRLLKTGMLARGDVVECRPTSMAVGTAASGNGVARVCDVTVDVSGLPNREPYRATCKHPIPMIYLPQMQAAGAAVAVRVDPDDSQIIALDLATEPPPTAEAPAGSVTIAAPTGDVEVPTHASPVKAPEILARGSQCRASLLMSTPLHQTNDSGLDVIGLVFTVTAGNGQPYQAQIGVGVPAGGMPLLFPGSDLPARALDEWLRNPSPPDMVTIDWDEAIAERAR
jgi:hypothetical protein